MNMAFIYILFLFLTVISISDGKAVFLSVQCNTETVGQYGQQSLLQCVVQSIDRSATIRVVTWWKAGAENGLLVFNNGEINHQPGYKFAEPSWNKRNMNVSLLITNTKLADDGDYRCTVITDSGDGISDIKLKVKAKYSAPIIHSNPEKITRNTAGNLVCDSHGGYPEGYIRWFVDGNTDWTTSSKMEVKKAQSGLFHLSSKLTLLQGSIFSEYTCVVFSASGVKEDKIIFKLQSSEMAGHEAEKGLEPASKIVAPVVVIGSLIVGLLLALLFYKRRSCSREVTYESGHEQDVQIMDQNFQNQV